MRPATFRTSALALLALLAMGAATAGGPAYDPLAVSAEPRPAPLDLTVRDSRQREIPLRIYLPAGSAAAPVVLFSHGLGGSREGSSYLATHWAARGFAAVFLQHPGSDEAVWRDKPPERRLAAMRRAANGENFLLRVQDVSAVLDQLLLWNTTPGHPLAGRLDGRHIGMAGHSFGALTTQAVSGQLFLGGRLTWTDPRIQAAVVLSPGTTRRKGDLPEAFSRVKIPWLLMTGTEDVSPIGNADVASRLVVFPALPPGGKYELVLDGAEHSAFSDRALPGDRRPRNPNHHRAILALSTAFWDAWLREDAAARAWLDGAGPAAILEPKDRWQRK